jgi:hypothetical protein
MNEKHLSNRRNFPRTIGATTVVAGAVGVEPLLQPEQSQAHAAPANRANQNLQHPSNLDEELYSNKLGSYSKGLPNNNDGTVVLTAYNALTTALKSGQPDDFNAIPMGADRRLTNPQAGLALILKDWMRMRFGTQR